MAEKNGAGGLLNDNMVKTKYISYKDIMSHIPIQKGDIVSVSCDILRLMCVCRDNNEFFDPNIFIDTIIKKIGKGGTLLFPMYNWGFCKGKTFDYRNTLSQVGALNNVALKRKDFRRTKHPIYSFAVWGKDQNHLCGLNNYSAWGPDSPFAYLHENNAKHLCIGVDYKDSMSFFHYPEEKVGVDYRFFKDFTAPYIDEHGGMNTVTYGMYVRDLTLKVESAIHPLMDDVLLKKKLYLKYEFNGIHFGLLELGGTGDVMINDIRTKGGLIYLKKLN